jgi:hypothetical protein
MMLLTYEILEDASTANLERLAGWMGDQLAVDLTPPFVPGRTADLYRRALIQRIVRAARILEARDRAVTS